MYRIEPIEVTINLVDCHDNTDTLKENHDPRIKELKQYLVEMNKEIFTYNDIVKFINGNDIKVTKTGFINYSQDIYDKSFKPLLNSFDAFLYFLDMYKGSVSLMSFTFFDLDVAELSDSVDIQDDFIPSNIVVNNCRINLCSFFEDQDRDLITKLLSDFGIANYYNNRFEVVKNIHILTAIKDMAVSKIVDERIFSLLLNSIPNGLNPFGESTIVFREFEHEKNNALLKNEYTGFNNIQ